MLLSGSSVHRFEVIVGNIGKVYQGDDASSALEVFIYYKQRSINNCGRGANEPVTLIDGENIQYEYNPSDNIR